MQWTSGRHVVGNKILAYVPALLFVLFTPFMVCLSAANDDSTALTIVGGDTIELTWNEILRTPVGINTAKRAGVMLCNMSNQRTAGPVTVTLMGFNFRSYYYEIGLLPPADELVLDTKPDFYELSPPLPKEGQVQKTKPEVAKSIGPQACVRIPISANPRADYTPPDAGKYSGFLVVAVSGVPKVKKPMVITVPPVAPAEADVTLVVSRWTPWHRQATINVPLNLGTIGAGTFKKGTMRNYGSWPIGRLATTEASISVRLQRKELEKTVEKIIQDEKERRQAIPSGDLALQSPLEPELVPPPGGVLDLPVTIEGIKRVGTYSGHLTVANSTIPLKIRVTDGPIFPFLAIVFGVGVGFLIPTWVGRYRHREIFRARMKKVEADYNDASANFEQQYGQTDYPWRSYNLPPEIVKGFLSEVKSELNAYARQNWLFNTSSEEYKKLSQRLDSAAADAQVLGAVEGEGFGPSLERLRDIWQAGPLADDSHLSTLDSKARDLLTGRLQGFVLKVGDAQKLKAQAAMYAQALKRWRELNELLRRFEEWSLAILNAVKDSKDVSAARHTQARIRVLKRQLKQAPDLASLEALGSSDLWTRIYEQLAYLSQVAAVPEPSEERGTTERQLPEFPETFVAGTQGRKPRASQVIGWLWEKIRSRWVRLGDIGVACLSLLIAILAAMNQYYFGKTFGTLTDYVTVSLLGSGIQLTTRTLVDVVAQLRSVRLT